MGKHDDLLARFAPALRYDSNEQFFADDAAQFTDAPGIELRRAATILASPQRARGKEPKLTLASLGPATYANGRAVEKTDAIGARGKDSRAQYVKLRQARPDLNNRLYARAVDAN